MCFRFVDARSAERVAAHLATLHPFAPAVVLGDSVHVSEALWLLPLAPEVLLGSLGRLTACAHEQRRAA
jgi:hypothetical protein